MKFGAGVCWVVDMIFIRPENAGGSELLGPMPLDQAQYKPGSRVHRGVLVMSSSY